MTFHANDDVKKITYEGSKVFHLFGLTSNEAHVFSYVYITKTPHSLDELSEALGKSKSSIHTAIRTLTYKNLVKRVWKKGVRKGIYEAHDDIYKPIMQMMMTEWQETIQFQLSSLTELQEQLSHDIHLTEERPYESITDRLEKLIDFHKKLEVTCRDKSRSL